LDSCRIIFHDSISSCRLHFDAHAAPPLVRRHHSPWAHNHRARVKNMAFYRGCHEFCEEAEFDGWCDVQDTMFGLALGSHSGTASALSTGVLAHT
jgi:hypothetical protein